MMTPIADYLSESSLSHIIGELDNSVFVLQTVHILSIAALMLSSLVVVLRSIAVIGAPIDIQREVARHKRFLVGSLIALVVTGAALVLSDPYRTVLNAAFQVKVPLVVLLAMVLFWIFSCVSKSSRDGGNSAKMIRIGSYSVIVLMAVIIFLGRWIGYS